MHPPFRQLATVGRRWRLGRRWVIGGASWQDIVGSSTEEGAGPNIQSKILVLVTFLHFQAMPQLALSAVAMECHSPPTLCLSLTAFSISASEASPQWCATGSVAIEATPAVLGNRQKADKLLLCAETPRNSQTVKRYLSQAALPLPKGIELYCYGSNLLDKIAIVTTYILYIDLTLSALRKKLPECVNSPMECCTPSVQSKLGCSEGMPFTP